MTRPGQAPRSAPAALALGLLLSLLLVTVAVITVRDLVVGQGWAEGSPWIPSWVDGLDGLTPGTPVLVAGIVAALVGLLVLVLALRPGRKTHVPAARGGDLWLTPDAVATVAATAADRTSGTLSATPVRATPRGATVQVLTRGGDGRAAQEAAREVVGDLTPMSISVKAKELSS